MEEHLFNFQQNDLRTDLTELLICMKLANFVNLNLKNCHK